MIVCWSQGSPMQRRLLDFIILKALHLSSSCLHNAYRGSYLLSTVKTVFFGQLWCQAEALHTPAGPSWTVAHLFFFFFFPLPSTPLLQIISEFVEQSETDETQGKIFQRGCVSVCGWVEVCVLWMYGQTPDETDLYPQHACIHQGASASPCAADSRDLPWADRLRDRLYWSRPEILHSDTDNATL